MFLFVVVLLLLVPDTESAKAPDHVNVFEVNHITKSIIKKYEAFDAINIAKMIQTQLEKGAVPTNDDEPKYQVLMDRIYKLQETVKDDSPDQEKLNTASETAYNALYKSQVAGLSPEKQTMLAANPDLRLEKGKIVQKTGRAAQAVSSMW